VGQVGWLGEVIPCPTVAYPTYPTHPTN
jgi:hypothetical protein